jgi:hypothetical protein
MQDKALSALRPKSDIGVEEGNSAMGRKRTQQRTMSGTRIRHTVASVGPQDAAPFPKSTT